MTLKDLLKTSLCQYLIFLILFNLYIDTRRWERVAGVNAIRADMYGLGPVAVVMYAETAVRGNPRNPDVFLFLAKSYWVQGRHFYGYRNYLKAVRLDPSIGKATREDYDRAMRTNTFFFPPDEARGQQ